MKVTTSLEIGLSDKCYYNHENISK